MAETRRRSLAKSLSWRVTGALSTILLVLWLTGKIDLALAVGSAEAVIKVAIFYAHERIWQRFRWGID